MIKNFQKEQIEYLKEKVSIIDIINTYNIPIDASYNDLKTIKIKDEYGYSGGFFVFKNGKGFIRHSTNEKGNIIDFCKVYFNDNYIEALNRINATKNIYKDNYTNNDFKKLTKTKNNILEKQIINKNIEFQFPEKDKNVKAIYYYLLTIRHLNQKLVSELINKGSIIQVRDYTFLSNDENGKIIKKTIKGTCVGFVGHNKTNNPKYVMLRSTNNQMMFKGEITGSKKKYSFKYIDKNINIDNANIYLFESAIDCLSHKTLMPNKTGIRISLAGTSNQAINQFISDYNLKNNKIILCLDNDEAGHIGNEKLKNELEVKGFKVEIEKPFKKDWNEDLDFLFNNYIKNNLHNKNI